MKRKGFVLLETIVVITVLCVILIALYGSYSNMLVNVKKKSNFDNTEFIYKTSVVRKYLEPRINIQSLLGGKIYGIYCSNSLGTYKNCTDASVVGYELFRFLGVNAVYITNWDAKAMGMGNYTELEATTQSYINSLDPEVLPNLAYRIIVMYETDVEHYEYSSLRFGSRG